VPNLLSNIKKREKITSIKQERRKQKEEAKIDKTKLTGGVFKEPAKTVLLSNELPKRLRQMPASATEPLTDVLVHFRRRNILPTAIAKTKAQRKPRFTKVERFSSKGMWEDQTLSTDMQ
jgi:hypothetical protein